MSEENTANKNRFRGKDKAVASLVCGAASLAFACIAIAAGFGEAFFMHGQSAAFVEGFQGQSIVAVAVGASAFDFAAVFSAPALAGLVLAKKSINAGGRRKIRTVGLALSILGAILGIGLMLTVLLWMGAGQPITLPDAAAFFLDSMGWLML